MERKRLLHSLLAISYDILSSCSNEQLEQALEGLERGIGIRLEPCEAVNIGEYDFLIEKIKRAFAVRRKRIPKPKAEQKPSVYPNLFTVTVPMTIDTSKLSKIENQILRQNMDKMLLVTMHQPSGRDTNCVKMRARIGIAVRHLWPEQKKVLGIKEDYIEEKKRDFYQDDVLAVSMILLPHMIHHFYKTLLWRDQFFGVPP